MRWVVSVVLAMITVAHAEIVPAAPQGLAQTEVHAEQFGVKGDGVADETNALQAAIDATAKKHGTLVLKPGTYLTGSLFLKSGMTLRLDRGVRLQGAQDIAAYPRRFTRIAGVEITWPSALLNVYGQHDVRIVGDGTVDGNGRIFWQRFWDVRKAYEPQGLRWAADYDAERPRLVQIYDSSRVELGGGLTLTRSGFWTVQVVYSHDVRVSGVTIRNNIDGRGPSTDGIDIDSSHHVMVEDADIDVNDDALCLKAGRDADGLRVNRPTEHVIIRNSIVRSAAAGVTFGSETSGGIHDVEVYGLKVVGPAGAGILFKSARTRGGTVSDIRIHDVDVANVETAFRVNLNWNPAYSYAALPAGIYSVPAHWRILTTPVPMQLGLPHIRNIEVRNMRARALVALQVDGYPEAPVENLRFDMVDISSSTAGALTHVRNLRFTRFHMNVVDRTKPRLDDAEDVQGLD